jgi:hypothetical protein
MRTPTLPTQTTRYDKTAPLRLREAAKLTLQDAAKRACISLRLIAAAPEMLGILRSGERVASRLANGDMVSPVDIRRFAEEAKALLAKVDGAA